VFQLHFTSADYYYPGCKVLNFIHRVLDYDMARSIPAGANGDEETEVLHVADFEGLQLHVCVVYLKKRRCYATIKVIGEDGKAVDYDHRKETKVNGTSDDAATKKIKKNKHTKGGALIKDELNPETNGTKDEALGASPVVDKEILPGLVGQKTRRYVNHDWAPRWNPLVTALKVYISHDTSNTGWLTFYRIVCTKTSTNGEKRCTRSSKMTTYLTPRCRYR